MNTTKVTLLSIIAGALFLSGCVNQEQQEAQVEYAKPIHVTRTVQQKRVYANGTKAVRQKAQVGVVQPYVPDGNAQVISSSTKVTETVSTASSSKKVVSYSNSSDDYIVKPGDTLYSVAFSHGMDYRDVAKINNIDAPYNISVGQRITFNQSTTKVVENNKVNTKPTTQPKVVPVAGSTNTTTTTASQSVNTASIDTTQKVQVVGGSSKTVSGISWMWPAKGTVVKNFSSTNKGIDIAGTRGQNINAAAAGQVVYSGNALRGYGNLIIINHNNEFLSAYAHNDMLLVKEGQKVKKGQVIAKMGATDADRVKLHFEVRYKGNSVNPRKYLP